MMSGVVTLLAVALIILVAGWLLKQGGSKLRGTRGLGDGRTIALDDVTLSSTRLGLVGRPDRLIRQGGTIIVEEWKSAKTVRLSHQAQMGVYFLLVEDQLNVVPEYGVIVLGNGQWQRIDNSPALRDWVLEMVGQIRLADGRIDQPIEVSPPAALCRPCGMRVHCSQARG